MGSERPDSLFNDPLAYVLAGREGRVYSDGMAWILTPRTAFGDQVMSKSFQSNVRQTVIVGAGMDARAFRLHMPGMHVFEVDQQTIFDVKEPIVRDAPVTCAKRHIVSVDLSQSPFGDALISSGFMTSEPSCWLLEGIFPYLSQEAVDALLVQMSSLAAPGSVVFHDSLSEAVVRNGASCCGAKFLFGCDDYMALWQKHGFSSAEAIDFDDIVVDRHQRRLQVHRNDKSNVTEDAVKRKPSTYFVTVTK